MLEDIWSLVAEAQGNEAKLQAILDSKNRDEIIQFYRDYTQAVADIKSAPWMVSLEDYSEDDRSDLAEYIVAKGKESYDLALSSSTCPLATLPVDTPSFKGVAVVVYRKKFGGSIPR